MTSQFTAWPNTQGLLRPSNDREAEMPLALADLQSQNTRWAMAARRGGDGGRKPQAKRQRQQSPCAGPGSAGAERRQGWRRHWWSRALASPGNSFACSRQSRHTCATRRKARGQGVGLPARGGGADGRRVRGRADKEATSRGMVAAEWRGGLGLGCKLLSEVMRCRGRWRNTGARHARRGLVSAHAALLVSAVSNQVIARLMRPCHLLRARIDKVPPTVANGGTRGRGWCQSRRRRAHLRASVPLTSWRTPSR